MTNDQIKYWLKQFTGFASPVRLDAIKSVADVGLAKSFEAHFGETFKAVPDADVWSALQSVRGVVS